MFGIEGVTDIHSGENDCLLEWQLFQKIEGRTLLAIDSAYGRTNIYSMTPDYVIPISYLRFPNLKKLLDLPYVQYNTEEVYRLSIKGRLIKRFPSNFSGVTIEHLINSMLHVKKVDSSAFLTENKRKLGYVGCINRFIIDVPLVFNQDGTVSEVLQRDKELVSDLNTATLELKKRVLPLIEFVQNEIFGGSPILSQELSIDNAHNVLALCDLSNESAILEIKTMAVDMESCKEQLFYEARGRESYILGIDWKSSESSVDFYILKVNLCTGEKPDLRKTKAVARLKESLDPLNIDVTEYKSQSVPVGLKCKNCHHEWSESVSKIRRKGFACPKCHPKTVDIIGSLSAVHSSEGFLVKENGICPEERNRERAESFKKRVESISSGIITIDVNSYTGSRNLVKCICNNCGNEWKTRADHLIDRCRCPACRKHTLQ